MNTPNKIPKVTGIISYDVRVKCPHCKDNLGLTQYPYSDETTEYCLGEDELGLAVFGCINKPANWSPEIQYKCYRCTKDFILNQLEI